MNKTNKILAGIFLLVVVVSASLYFKRYDEYRAQINNAMKDPGSTEFKNENVSSDGVYCAEVNSKNSYGAFVGFERVMARADRVKSYVFFERDGLEGNSVDSVNLELEILLAKLQAKNNAKERELAGGGEAILTEAEYKKIAVREVFEKEWSKNCLLKITK